MRTMRHCLYGTAAVAAALAAACVHGPARGPEGPNPDTMGAGYSARQPRSMETGAVETILIQDNERSRYSTIEQLLQGRIAGLEVLRSPDGVHIHIRGTSSINMPTDPLVVIDGVPVPPGQMQNAFAAITPDAVARVDVLKDAGATSIYGVRGANGVILITTRRGDR